MPLLGETLKPPRHKKCKVNRSKKRNIKINYSNPAKDKVDLILATLNPTLYFIQFFSLQVDKPSLFLLPSFFQLSFEKQINHETVGRNLR